jgi:hypothetical protein
MIAKIVAPNMAGVEFDARSARHFCACGVFVSIKKEIRHWSRMHVSDGWLNAKANNNPGMRRTGGRMEYKSNSECLAEAKEWAKTLSSKELDHELRMHGANHAWHTQAIEEEIQEREQKKCTK